MKTVLKINQDGTPVFSNQRMSVMNAAGDFDANTLGYQRALTTLTYQKKKVTTQKFFRVAPADFIPMAVGEGAFSQSILTHQTISTSGDFEEGIISQGISNARLARSTVGITSKTIQIKNWAKSIDYSIFEIEQAMQANNWDAITAIHNARKENWDLGIQKLAFLGLASDQTNFPGLLTQTSATTNTSLITQLLNTMSYTQYATFIADLLEAYRSNCNRSAYPTHFVIPEDDWNGLVAPFNPAFPVVSQLQYLRQAFSDLGLGGIKIMPCAYAMPAYNKTFLNSGTGYHVYTFYNFDETSIRMDVPVWFTPTAPNTWNNFNFQDVAYGQFGGVQLYRNLELMYFVF